MSNIRQSLFGLSFLIIGEVSYTINPNTMAAAIAGAGIVGLLLGMGDQKP